VAASSTAQVIACLGELKSSITSDLGILCAMQFLLGNERTWLTETKITECHQRFDGGLRSSVG
jgi:hypothetical protein